jgi:hypothetical protein
MTRTRVGFSIAILTGLIVVLPLLSSSHGQKEGPSGVLAASAGPAAESPGATDKAPTLNGVDFTGLTQEQISVALQVLSENRCNCGCGMTLSECRTKDPSCSRSLAVARGVVQDLKNGKDKTTVQSNVVASLARLAVPPPAATAAPPRPQEDPNKVYKIDIAGSPYKGPKRATVVLVEFSDYQ